MPNCCQSEGCGKEASMQCPTCTKMGLSPAYFCSQECFKKSWATHKALHVKPPMDLVELRKSLLAQAAKEERARVHPGVISPRREVPPHIERPDYAEGGRPLSEIKARMTHFIPVLTPEEQEIMRKVCKLGREVLDVAARAVKPGVTTDEIDRIVHEACIERECYPSPLNYYEFPKSCCTSVNEVICHGIPDSRELNAGEIINIDISVYKWGFHADLNETYYVGGKTDEIADKLTRTTYECLMKAIEYVRPGHLYRELGNIISKHAHANGFSVVRTYCGHGVGRLFHGDPSVPHYAKNKAVGVMKPGHVFTIEPMINEGVWKDHTWADGWTSVTADAKRSAQFEHTLLVTENGCDILTARTEDSVPLPFLANEKSQ